MSIPVLIFFLKKTQKDKKLHSPGCFSTGAIDVKLQNLRFAVKM